jgi:hypothetical protein
MDPLIRFLMRKIMYSSSRRMGLKTFKDKKETR